MRSISLVHRLELEFHGNICKHAITLGDVDGDDDNELIACSTNGSIYIFKGKHHKPWKSCDGLGILSCVVFGKITDDANRDYCCCANSRGVIYLFDLAKHHVSDRSTDLEEKHINSNETSMKPSFHQSLPVNPNMLVLEDIDNDGQNELIIGYTDRYVRIYKWKAVPTESEEPLLRELEARTKSYSFSKRSTVVKQSSKESMKDVPDKEASSETHDSLADDLKGSFELQQEIFVGWRLGSIGVCKGSNDELLLIASQLNGGYGVIASFPNCNELSEFDLIDEASNLSKDGNGIVPLNEKSDSFSTTYSIFDNRKRNRSLLEAEIVGSIHREGVMSGVLGLCCLSGVFMSMDLKTDSIASRNTDQRLFQVQKFNADNDGNDRIAMCSWDGMSYITERGSGDLICFNFGDNVCGFTAGQYAYHKGINSPCLVFVTFNNRIVICYDLKLEVKVWNLQEALMEHLSKNPDVEHLLSKYSEEMPTHPAYFKPFIQKLWSMKSEKC